MIHPKIMQYVCTRMYTSPTNIRGCIQHGLFPWATCYRKEGSKSYSYFIRPEMFRQEFGVSPEEVIGN